MIIRRIPVRVKMSVGFEVVGDLIANYLPGSAFFWRQATTLLRQIRSRHPRH